MDLSAGAVFVAGLLTFASPCVLPMCQGKRVRIRLADVTEPEGKALARRFGVGGIPVFAFLDAGGSEVARLVGYQKIESLEQAMSVLIGEACATFRPLPELRAPPPG